MQAHHASLCLPYFAIKFITSPFFKFLKINNVFI
nr:MAG TPA: hypothetical protein [Caudoviricetes sp.]